MRRIVMIGVLFSVVCGLCVMPTAHAATEVELCGFATGLADGLIITGLAPEGGPFVMVTGWVQFVPTLYTLLGSGSFVRTPGDVHTFSGGVLLTNNTDAFANNPICAVSPVVQIDDPRVPSFSGSAQMRCVAGDRGPFTVTIQFTLIPCDDPGPFTAAVEAQPVSKVPAGYAPNEYRHRP
jgi:hypothetical protein